MKRDHHEYSSKNRTCFTLLRATYYSLCTSQSTVRLLSVSCYVPPRTAFLFFHPAYSPNPPKFFTPPPWPFLLFPALVSFLSTNSSSTYTVWTRSISRAPLSSPSRNPATLTSRQTRTLGFSWFSYLSHSRFAKDEYRRTLSPTVRPYLRA